MKIALLAVGLMLFGAPGAPAMVNPHIDSSDNSSCLQCHVPGFETASSGEYTLIAETIDAVCLTCHVKTECCRIGQEHMKDLYIGFSHPSDMAARDIQRESRPKTLPLQDGKLTCNTCHLHRKPEGRDHKLVRLVEFTDTEKGVEWTQLCLDCHAELP